MKIAILIFKYFARGGVQRDMTQAAAELIRRGADVEIFCTQADDPAPAGCRLTVIPVKSWSNHGRAEEFQQKFAAIRAEKEFDAVIGFNRMAGLDIYFAGDDCLCRNWQGIWNWLSPRRRKFLELEKAAVGPAGAKMILTLTAQQEKDYQQWYGTGKERLRRLNPGVADVFKSIPRTEEDRSRYRQSFAVPADKIFLVSVAASFYTKGVDRTCSILAALPEEMQKRIVWIIAGDDRRYARYERLTKNALFEARFIGGCDRIGELMQAADLLIHPARYEATGTILAESICSALAVLTTRRCGYADLVEEYKAGWVLDEPYSEVQWQKKLYEILNSPEALKVLRQDLSEAYLDKKFCQRSELIADLTEEFVRSRNGENK